MSNRYTVPSSKKLASFKAEADFLELMLVKINKHLVSQIQTFRALQQTDVWTNGHAKYYLPRLLKASDSWNEIVAEMKS